MAEQREARQLAGLQDHIDNLGEHLNQKGLPAVRPRSNDIQASCGKRHVFALLAHLGLCNVYAMRMDLSEAAEPMQKHFGWSDPQQGYVLSSFFWGYVIGQIPGAIMAHRFGGKRVFGFGVLGTSVLTLVLPLCAQQLWLFYCVRALMGLMEATTYPALNEMFTHWVPAPERAVLVTVMNAGGYIGNALAMPIAGAIITMGQDSTGVSNTWPIAFYTFGAISCFWFIFWEYCTASTPAQHKYLTSEERAYLAATTHQDADVIGEHVSVTQSERVPWKAFFTHPAAWALYANHFTYNYGVYTMMTYMPKFLKEELGMDMKHAGFVSFLPYVLMAVVSSLAGWFADRMTRRCHIRLVRVICMIGGFAGSGAFMVLLGFLTDNHTAAVIAMSASISLSGISNAALGPNFMDISPYYASQLYGISNTIGNLSGIIAPILAGALLGGDAGSAAVEDWRKVFYIAAILYGTSSLIWLAFMQAKPIQALN